MSRTPEQMQLVENWLHLANENYQFAQSGIGQEFSPYSSVCSLCQQSAEKYLKAYLLDNNWTLRKTHDLKQLLEFAGHYDADFTIELDQDAVLLNDYVVMGRYPDEMQSNRATESDAKAAVAATGRVRAFVLARLNL